MSRREPDWVTYKNKADANAVRVVGITGASRCGKTQLAEWLRRHHPAKIRIISQDTFFKDSKHMPKVSLQGAPFVSVAFWDSAESVDWATMISVVQKAIDDAPRAGIE